MNDAGHGSAEYLDKVYDDISALLILRGDTILGCFPFRFRMGRLRPLADAPTINYAYADDAFRSGWLTPESFMTRIPASRRAGDFDAAARR